MIVNRPKKKKKISRYTVLCIIMGILFSAIVLKLLYIQVYKHVDYKEKADTSSTRFISEEAPRGKIYDSEGNVLATNVQTYTLTYTKPNDENEDFYGTMDKVFQILSENNEKVEDDLLLKIDSNGKFYFDFKTGDLETKKSIEIRFKRDRGLNEDVEKDRFEDTTDLTDEQIEEVNEELLKISPEETFYELVKIYHLEEVINKTPVQGEGESEKNYKIRLSDYNDKIKGYEDKTGKEILDELLASGYELQKIRSYIVVKDAIKMQSFQGSRSVDIALNIKKDTAFIIYQKSDDLPGIDVSIEPIRYYPYNNLASAALGYISPISSSNEENYQLRGYDASSDLIGVAGIESALEEQLRGTKGGTTVKVNSKGKVTEELFKLDSYPGNNVHLTINKDVQYAAEQATKDTMERVMRAGISTNATRGSVVAIEVNTGRVIAMVSYPSYDPNIFSIPGRLTEEQYQAYFDPDIDSFAKEYMRRTGATGSIDNLFPINEETGERYDGIDVYPKPFFNYATQGLLPPGSTFKPLTATAALMEGVLTTGEVVNDTGYWDKTNQGLKNFEGGVNGLTDVRKALQVSSNFFFYEMGYRLWQANGGVQNEVNPEALNALAKYAYKFGLGVDPNSEEAKNPETGIQIEENFGQVYNFESWKNKMIETPMYGLVEALKSGYYSNLGISFIPFNIEDNENDPDELKEAKTKLKDYMKESLTTVGTNENVLGDAEFSESLVPYVKRIMELSDEYKGRVKESSARRNVDIDDEARTIGDIIMNYLRYDLGPQIGTPGQIVSSAIGQGMNNFTPLQTANYVATLANGGKRYKLTLVDKITTPTGEIIKEFTPEVVDTLDIPESYLQAVKEGMYRVNTSPSNGTAYQSFGNFPIKVGGKTGTADFSTDENYIIQGRRAYGNYISMAPLDNPQIAIFSTIYDGNRGSEGATIHRAIYEAYFKDELLKMDPNYASKSESFRKYIVDSPLKDNKDDSMKLEGATTVSASKTEEENKISNN